MNLVKYVHGSRKVLSNPNLDFIFIDRALERIQLAVPHLIISKWKAFRNIIHEESGAFQQHGRRELRLQIIFLNWELQAMCSKTDSGVLSLEDKVFLDYLAKEAGDILRNLNNPDSSLTNFGAISVSNFLKNEFQLKKSPLSILQFLRNISQQTYENQRIPYGIVILPNKESNLSAPLISALENKRFKHLTDGYSTAFFVDTLGNLLGIEALPSAENSGKASRRRPNWFSNLAEVSQKKGGIGIGLNRNGDVLIAINGKLAFSQRSGIWKKWDHSAIIALLQKLPKFEGKPYDFTDVLTYIYQVSLDLSFKRSGGLFIILSNIRNKNKLLSSREQLGSFSKNEVDQSLDKCLSNKKIYLQDRRLTTDLASLDGAIVIDRNGGMISYGQVIRIVGRSSGGEQGARTRAAKMGSRFGLAIKISSDGDISFYKNGKKEFEI